MVSGPVVSHGPGDTRLRTESGGGWSHHWITIITSLSCQAPGHAEAAPRLAGAGPRSWRRCGRWCRPSPPWTPAARSAPARASTGPNGIWILTMHTSLVLQQYYHTLPSGGQPGQCVQRWPGPGVHHGESGGEWPHLVVNCNRCQPVQVAHRVEIALDLGVDHKLHLALDSKLE